MGKQTITEIIISNKIGDKAIPSKLVVAPVDLVMAHDATAPLALSLLGKQDLKPIENKRNNVFVIDHYVPCPSEKVAAQHDIVRQYALTNNEYFYEAGQGICHQLLAEKGHVSPGDLILGADSHTCTLGALGALAIGVGSTDIAVAMMTGKVWLRVPYSIKVIINNTLRAGVYAKDLILKLIQIIGTEGANYRSIEYSGAAIDAMKIEDRMTICNMSIEMGAKTGIIAADQKTSLWLANRNYNVLSTFKADEDALYEKVYEVDASTIEPLVALPHTLDSIARISDCKNIPINVAFLGSCTNGRYEDLEVAAKILGKYGLSKSVRLIVVPASKDVFLEALQKDVIEILVSAGAQVVTPGCGLCGGAANGIPSDGENVISTSNRNFVGRMGNDKANIFISSPATLASSCVTGKLTDPRAYI